ncbi:MAG: cell division protein ZapA, partial [Bacteroidota bacterium]
IKVNIADRFYPLNIERMDEEKIRNAARKINDTIVQYRQKYADKDSQDFLAMAALQFVTKLIDLENKQDISHIADNLKNLDLELEEYLRNS